MLLRTQLKAKKKGLYPSQFTMYIKPIDKHRHEGYSSLKVALSTCLQLEGSTAAHDIMKVPGPASITAHY